MKVVATEKAPAAVGPYSQGIVSGALVFVSGQLGVDNSGRLGEGMIDQTELAIDHLREILGEAGCILADVVKTTCYLAKGADLALFNEIYGKYFIGKPARSLVITESLPKGSLVEIEAIAERKEEKE